MAILTGYYQLLLPGFCSHNFFKSDNSELQDISILVEIIIFVEFLQIRFPIALFRYPIRGCPKSLFFATNALKH